MLLQVCSQSWLLVEHSFMSVIVIATTYKTLATTYNFTDAHFVGNKKSYLYKCYHCCPMCSHGYSHT